MRYALLCDTGAPDNAAGREWLAAFAADSGFKPQIEAFRSKLSGIGSGSADIREKWAVPTGMIDRQSVTHEGLWQAQCLEGIGAKVPPLWGLSSQIARATMFDFRDAQNLNCSCTAMSKPNERAVFDLLMHHGHILLPVDWGGFPLPNKDVFLKDPLGLEVWFADETPSETTDTFDLNLYCAAPSAAPPNLTNLEFDSTISKFYTTVPAKEKRDQ